MDLSINRGNRCSVLVFPRATPEFLSVGLNAKSHQSVYCHATGFGIRHQHHRLLSRLTTRSSGQINRFAIDAAA